MLFFFLGIFLLGFGTVTVGLGSRTLAGGFSSALPVDPALDRDLLPDPSLGRSCTGGLRPEFVRDRGLSPSSSLANFFISLLMSIFSVMVTAVQSLLTGAPAGHH